MSKPTTVPAYATPPGDTLLETIQALGMSQIELESRTGINKKTINRIIKGKEPITQKTALALEKVLKKKGLAARTNPTPLCSNDPACRPSRGRSASRR